MPKCVIGISIHICIYSNKAKQCQSISGVDEVMLCVGRPVLYCTVLHCTVHTLLYFTLLYIDFYCTVLYFTVLYCTVHTLLYFTLLYIDFYCTVLYFTVLHCILLYCTVFYCTVLYFTILYCILLYCTLLYCTVFYCTVLYFTVLYCILLYYTVFYFTVLYFTESKVAISEWVRVTVKTGWHKRKFQGSGDGKNGRFPFSFLFSLSFRRLCRHDNSKQWRRCNEEARRKKNVAFPVFTLLSLLCLRQGRFREK